MDLYKKKSDIVFIDTHAHLDHKRFEYDVDQVIDRAGLAKIQSIITIGANLLSSRQAVEITRRYHNIVAAVGIHPHDASKIKKDTLDEIELLAQNEKVIAIGEIGLDYYYDFSPRDAQCQVFSDQINLAKKLNLPIVVHIREAYEDALDILESEHAEDLGGVIHCFSGDQKAADTCLNMGFYISVGGILTFPNSKELQRIVKDLPLDRILLETDAPYLTPVPYRGKRNEPAYIVYVAKTLANLKGITVEEVARVTTLNAYKCFNLKNI